MLNCYCLSQSSRECLSHKLAKAIAPRMSLITMLFEFLTIELAIRGANDTIPIERAYLKSDLLKLN